MLKRFLPRREKGGFKKFLFWATSILIGLFCLGIIAGAALIAVLSIGLPDVTSLENVSAAESTEIFDRDGELLYTIHGEENREQIELEEISQNLINATIAIEDDAFWEHKGFDIFALGKVALYEIFGIGSPRGGSTITQQYIKNTFLSSERTYTRKAKELILALRLERAYEKEEILELYLNRIPYGNNAYGIQKASKVYFDKNASDLNIGESAILASLPQAPSRFNPYGDNKYSHLLKEFGLDELEYRDIESEYDLEIEEYARGLIGRHVNLGNGETVYIAGRSDSALKRMEDLGFISSEERQKALNEIQSLEFNDYKEAIEHPHFVLYIKQILEEKYGKDVVEQGGLKVHTTIDGELQKHAEELALAKGTSNETNFGANNMAIFSVNPKTGEILVMVGSRDYFNEDIDGNVNVVTRVRQPGSSFKPIVYAQAFYKGFAPGSVIYDVPIKIGVSDKPENYDGKWEGQISIRQALGHSRNIPAIKTYFLAGQQDEIIDLAEKMGITSLDKSHSYGYPLALGAGEISLYEMVRAFSVFANNGKLPEITGILKIENSNGDILEELRIKEFEEVMDPQVAYMINSILSDPAYSLGANLSVDGHLVAAKTGTSTKENKKKSGGTEVRPSDAWTIGYSPAVVTGVWVGNSDGAGLAYSANGYDAASPAFNSVMSKALEDLSPEPFPEPKGIKHVEISSYSGKLPGKSTPSTAIKTDIFASFSVPTETENNIYQTVSIDKISGLLANEFTPEDAIVKLIFQNYEPIEDLFNWKQEIINYYNKTGISLENLDSLNDGDMVAGLPPTEYDNIHTPETLSKAPSIKITSPSSNSLTSSGNLKVNVELEAKNGVKEVQFFFDNEKKYFTKSAPYTGNILISKFVELGTSHLITAKVIDEFGYSDSSNIEIKVLSKEDLEKAAKAIEADDDEDDEEEEDEKESEEEE